MDRQLSPIHRTKTKCVYFDVFTSSVIIFIIEISMFSSYFVYYSVMMGSYYENGRKTSFHVFAQSRKDIDVPNPYIPHDLIYWMLLLGFVTCFFLSVFLILGICWLFLDFLSIWVSGASYTTIYLAFVLTLDGIFSRRSFPYELLYVLVRCYFIYIIHVALKKQIREDSNKDYDYKKFAQEQLELTQTKFINVNEEEGTLKIRCCMFLLEVLGCFYQKKDIISPVQFSDKEAVIKNIMRDICPEQSTEDFLENEEQSKIVDQSAHKDSLYIHLGIRPSVAPEILMRGLSIKTVDFPSSPSVSSEASDELPLEVENERKRIIEEHQFNP